MKAVLHFEKVHYYSFQEGRLGFHSFGNTAASAAPSVTSSQNFTDLSLSHLANSWNHQEPGPQANAAVPPPSITLTAAAAASSVGMSHT